MRGLTLFVNLALGLLLAGCSANFNSIHRSDRIASGGSYTLIDAKQRALIEKNAKVCTEPPPDVFSVYAQSLAASGSVSKGTDPTTLGASGSLAVTSAETGATIGRTQAYNLLALQAFYNCLSSLNNDSGKLEAPIDRVRLQRLIVSTIAIEQLTGVMRAPTVVIGAGGASSGGGSAEAMATLAAARKDDQTSKQNLKSALDEKAKLESADPKCSALAARVKNGETLAGAELAKSESCTKADVKVAAMQTASDDAGKYYQAQLASSGAGMSATADTHTIDPKVIEAASQRDATTVQKVADTIGEIVKNNFAPGDETKFFCMRMLYDPQIFTAAQTASPDNARDIANGCAALLLTDVGSQVDQARYEIYKANYAAATVKISAAADASFGRYWAKVVDAAGAFDAAKAAPLLDPLISAKGVPASTVQRLKALKSAAARDAARAAFDRIPPDLQATLAN